MFSLEIYIRKIYLGEMYKLKYIYNCMADMFARYTNIGIHNHVVQIKDFTA